VSIASHFSVLVFNVLGSWPGPVARVAAAAARANH